MRNRTPFQDIFTEIENNLFRPSEHRRFHFNKITNLLPHSGLLATDILETAEGYEFHINTPGFKKEEIGVEVVDNVLKVSLKRNTQEATTTETTPQNQEATVSQEAQPQTPAPRVLYSERSQISVNRQYGLPEKADVSKIEAAYDNGTLVLKIAKLVPSAPLSNRIEIK